MAENSVFEQSEGHKSLVCVKIENIFIAGSSGADGRPLQACKVYNMLTDEWQLIASLKLPRVL